MPQRFNFTRDIVERADPAKLALRFVDGAVRNFRELPLFNKHCERNST